MQASRFVGLAQRFKSDRAGRFLAIAHASDRLGEVPLKVRPHIYTRRAEGFRLTSGRDNCLAIRFTEPTWRPSSLAISEAVAFRRARLTKRSISLSVHSFGLFIAIPRTDR